MCISSRPFRLALAFAWTRCPRRLLPPSFLPYPLPFLSPSPWTTPFNLAASTLSTEGSNFQAFKYWVPTELCREGQRATVALHLPLPYQVRYVATCLLTTPPNTFDPPSPAPVQVQGLLAPKDIPHERISLGKGKTRLPIVHSPSVAAFSPIGRRPPT